MLKVGVKKEDREQSEGVGYATFMGKRERSGEFVDPAFFKVNLTLGGKRFVQDVGELLRVSRSDYGELSDAELDVHLELCSYYRYTFHAGYVEALAYRESLEKELKQWVASKRDEMIERRIVARKTLIEKGAKSGWLGQITEGEIVDALMLVHWQEYDARLGAVAEAKKNEKLLYGVCESMSQRGFHLMNIANRRNDFRNRGDYSV